MALVWADFPSGQKGLYGTTRTFMLNGIWAAHEGSFVSSGLSIVADPDPAYASTGYVLRFQQTGSSGEWSDIYSRLTYPAAVATAGLGFRLWMSQYPAADSFAGSPEWEFRNISNTLIARMRVGASGQIIIHNSAGTVIHTSDPAILITNAYNHVETKVLRHASAGTIEIRVNSAVKVNISGLALGANDIVNVCLGQDNKDSGISTVAAYFKDVVFWDGSGSNITDFQGAVFVRDIVPDGDSSLNWTPSTGATGWDLVDEGDAGPVDTDYISADQTQTTPTVFTMTDLPPDVLAVRAVMPIARLVKSDGGDATVMVSVSPNGVDYDDGEDRTITVASTYYKDVSYVSPDTGTAWTPSEVDDMVYKIDRTT